MIPAKSRALRILLSIVGCLVTVLWLLTWWLTPTSDVPVFRDLSWLGMYLSVRYETPAHDKLLITRAEPLSPSDHHRDAPYYRYDPATRTLNEVPRSMWEQAKETIVGARLTRAPLWSSRVHCRDGKLSAVRRDILHFCARVLATISSE